MSYKAIRGNIKQWRIMFSAPIEMKGLQSELIKIRKERFYLKKNKKILIDIISNENKIKDLLDETLYYLIELWDNLLGE